MTHHGVILTADQQTACAEILEAHRNGVKRHALTGYAGTGKSTLTIQLVKALQTAGDRVAVTSPTHKACAVLDRLLTAAGVRNVHCGTIHALLGLRPEELDGKQRLVRQGRGYVDNFDTVLIDEASMVGQELYARIERALAPKFTLFIGDPAQLPPVGEPETLCFQVPSRSHLQNIVRQAAGNPILRASQIIRESQGGPPDWSWTSTSFEPGIGGIIRLGDAADERIVLNAFTSQKFREDNDAFRFLCWTNAAAAHANHEIRKAIYGNTLTPFVIGERAIVREPLLFPNKAIAFQVNTETDVIDIQPREFQFEDICLPVWEVSLANPSAGKFPCRIPRDPDAFVKIKKELRKAALDNNKLWHRFYRFGEAIGRLHHIYASTVHVAQGSTFGDVFVDVADIRRMERHQTREMQQLLYTAVTRARETIYLLGTP